MQCRMNLGMLSIFNPTDQRSLKEAERDRLYRGVDFLRVCVVRVS